MNAKTSCFNKRIFTKNIWQAFPFILLMTFILLLSTLPTLQSHFKSLSTAPASTLSNSHMLVKQYLQSSICDSLMKVVLVGYSFCSAFFVFRYLFSQRQCKTLHALPLRRSCLYITNICSGFALLLIPVVLTALIDGIYLGMHDCSVQYVLPWAAVAFSYSLFFYALTVFTIMITGHIVALPIIYIVLNFGYFFTRYILGALLHSLIYGLSYQMTTNSSTLFSPFIHLYQTMQYSWDTNSYTSDCVNALVLYTIIAILLLVCGLFLYKKRPLEAQGDPIIFHRLQPVFHYLTTLLCGSILTITLSEAFYALSISFFDTLLYMDRKSAVILLVLFLISNIAAYYVIKMLLNKTTHVFKTGYKGVIVYTAVLAIAYLCLMLDLFGIEQRIPDTADISSIELNIDSFFLELDEKQSIEAIREIHHYILEHKDELLEVASGNNDYSYTSISVEYTLKNKDTLLRTYYVPWESDTAKFSSYTKEVINKVNSLLNDTDILCKSLNRIFNEYTLDTLIINYPFTDDEDCYAYPVTSAKDQQELLTAIEQDILAGTLTCYTMDIPNSSDHYTLNLSYFIPLQSDSSYVIEDWHNIEFEITGECENVMNFINTHCDKEN